MRAVNHGKLIKKLRSERGITQNQLAYGISSRGTLAAFENRGSRISFDILIQYLERMNITLEEYSFLYMDSHVSDKRLLAKKMIHDTTDDESAGKIINNLYSRYKETGDNFYYFTYLMNDLLIQFLHDQEKDFSTSEEATILKKHLESVESWGRFELSILINCLFIFETDFIINAINYRIKKMKLFIDNTYFSSDWNSFIFNVLRLSFIRNEPYLRSYIFKNLESSFLDSSTFDRTKYVSFKLLHQLKMKNDSNVLNQLNAMLEAIKISGDDALYQFINEFKEKCISPR
ncbi:Rgg/GadR/MutR family transcriptional regulator [Candidatus Enterococcus courvalinii]|uniref:Helix-turn-helix domain-containing protein n=1 Tax=Candidatus Enterococcus courvalinii TaxID=2815329 RepID=A0ABS3HXV3_9ENTE|nr:Rgg/GadR/MutR family transcriptional regulator [Enterococcus sp. MSG2901]MBO0481295.1 helix-turn-helix domain-containing protein [Enterococcus sp. MSG2901]